MERHPSRRRFGYEDEDQKLVDEGHGEPEFSRSHRRSGRRPGGYAITEPTAGPSSAFVQRHQDDTQPPKKDKVEPLEILAALKPGSCVGNMMAFRCAQLLKCDSEDLLGNRMEHISLEKEGSQAIDLLTNYFKIESCSKAIYQHHVDFFTTPTEALRRLFRVKIQDLKKEVGQFVYDCNNKVYTNKRLHRKMVHVTDKIHAQVKFVEKFQLTDKTYQDLQGYLLHRILYGMDMAALGGLYYRPKEIKKYPKAQLAEGFVTSIENHDYNQHLLAIDPSHQIFGAETVLKMINRVVCENGDVSESLVGKNVTAIYNNKSYLVTSIDWVSSPSTTFQRHGGPTTYAGFFKDRYEYTTKDMEQPLLKAYKDKSNAKPMDYPPKPPTLVYLLPEACKLAGISNEMKSSGEIVDTLVKECLMTPKRRMEAILKFRKHFKRAAKLSSLMNCSWNFRLSEDLIRCMGRVLPKQKLMFGVGLDGSKSPVTPDSTNQWDSHFKKHRMLSPVSLDKWAVIVLEEHQSKIGTLLDLMTTAAESLGINVGSPSGILRLPTGTAWEYVNGVEKIVHDLQPEMILVVFPVDTPTQLYNSVLKKLSVELGVLSQFCSIDDFSKPNKLNNLARKLMIQINIKLGGEPWHLDLVGLKLKNLMIVGYDVASLPGKEAKDFLRVGSTVASINPSLTKYFSRSFQFPGHGVMGNLVKIDMLKCLKAYMEENNGQMPDQIIYYRASADDGEIEDIREVELDQIKALLAYEYLIINRKPPKFAYIVVNDKHITRLFTHDAEENPPVGTVVDTGITFANQYDFYLLSEDTSDATANPVHYNILLSTFQLPSEKLQAYTYAFCHLGYHRVGSTNRPTPVEYAHRMIKCYGGMNAGLLDNPHSKLSKKLHYI